MVVFEVVEFRASKSALGVGPKAPTSEDPVPVWYQLRPAGGHGWLQVAATGTAVSETDIFASSMCHCNIITVVHVKMLLVENIGHFDVEIDLPRSGGLEDMEVVNIKPLRRWSRCDRAGCTTCQKSSMSKCRNCSFMCSVRRSLKALSTQRGVRRSSLISLLQKGFLVCRARPGDDLFAG